MPYRNNFRKSRVGRVGEDPREDVRVGIGVVEFQLNCTRSYCELAVDAVAVGERWEDVQCTVCYGCIITALFVFILRHWIIARKQRNQFHSSSKVAMH